MEDSQFTIGHGLRQSGVTRRSFLKLCSTILLTPPGLLALSSVAETPQALAAQLSPVAALPLIWLTLQGCSGCSEMLLSSASQDTAKLVLGVARLQFHPLLMVASGQQAAKAFTQALQKYRGNYALVLEGALPGTAQHGALHLFGRDAVSIVQQATAEAALTIAVGSCASWGGVVAAAPNPTAAHAAVAQPSHGNFVSLPGCPPNPSVLAAVLLEFAAMRRLPALDEQARPQFAYGTLIHESCSRRAHFDAGRMARKFGDAKHRAGYCLFALGCKGPQTYAPCAERSFNDLVDCSPIANGAPCFGCAEKTIGFQTPAYTVLPALE